MHARHGLFERMFRMSQQELVPILAQPIALGNGVLPTPVLDRCPDGRLGMPFEVFLDPAQNVVGVGRFPDPSDDRAGIPAPMPRVEDDVNAGQIGRPNDFEEPGQLPLLLFPCNPSRIVGR